MDPVRIRVLAIILSTAVVGGLVGCVADDGDGATADGGAASTLADGRDASPITVVDAVDRTVRLDSPARRVVSLVPAATELLLELGAADRLVARTTYDDDERIADLPSVGGGLSPSVEALAALEPELVIAWRDSRDRRLVDRLEELGIATYSVLIRDFGEIDRVTRDLGALLGRAAVSDSLADVIERGIAEVRAAVADRPRPAVLYVVWGDPPITTGDGTFVDQVIEAAGGRNVFGDVERDWPQISLEAIVRRRPDVVVMPGSDEAGPGVSDLRSRAGWRDLEAVREGRIVRLDASLFNRPGPRVAEAARALAEALHPAAFAPETRR